MDYDHENMSSGWHKIALFPDYSLFELEQTSSSLHWVPSMVVWTNNIYVTFLYTLNESLRT